ncbi:MAG: ABC transporter permease [Firmicutes bacterium]|nr:ABC transporter permease [Bacillota bacterium]
MNSWSLKGALQKAKDIIVGPIIAIALALLLAGILIYFSGYEPLAAYGALFKGSVGNINSLAVTGVRMTPLLLGGLAVAMSFSCGVSNIGIEGQLYLGAVGATIVGLMPLPVPQWLHLLLVLAAGFVFGALWATVPGYLYAYKGVNEVVLTLMLNYVAIYLVSYLTNTVYGPLGEKGASYSQSPELVSTARLPILLKGSSLHVGLLVGIVLAIALYIFMNHTSSGFRLRMVGFNPHAAEYAGIPMERTRMQIMLLSGGLAGIAGASEVAGLFHRLYANFSPGYGFDAIAVSLLAGNNPLAVILSSAFYGALRAGATRMQQVIGIEVSIVFIIQAFTILFVTAGTVLSHRPSVIKKLFRFSKKSPAEGRG